ncbi:MAG: twin-arginine translocase TatA/TatE family subunit [Deltaproteobacteria bacterium]|nr:twin-arginine translocase TatA/TatE family subunit [Deltaproteobacteria bacterium]
MFSTSELIVILLILIVIFGASKLPKLGDALGRSIKNFKSAMNTETEKTESTGTDDKSKSKKSSKEA